MDQLWQDVRFALRSLTRRRTVGGISILTFGLGIAACTAMFSVVHTVLLRPLPYPEPDRVVNVYSTNPSFRNQPGFSGHADRGGFSYPEMEDFWRDGEDAMAGLAMAYTTNATLRPDDGFPERITVGITTPDLLGPVMQVTPLLGRVFVTEDGTDAPDALVLGEAFWRERYASDPAVVGQTLRLGDRTRTIVGVVPAGTRLQNQVPDAWMVMTPWENRGDHRTSAVGRLAPGVSIEEATARLSAVAQANVPENHSDHRVNIQPRHAEIIRGVSTPLLLLAGAAFLLLIIASANVAAILVGRMLEREEELAMRVALGASPFRIFRQIVTESVVLAGLGGVLGMLLSVVVLRGLLLIAPAELPRIDEVVLDGGVLAVSIGLALFAGLVAGVIPAARVLRAEANRNIRTRTPGQSRLQQWVVMTEVAMATVLLVGGGLLARTVTQLGNADAGFDVEQLVSFSVSLPGTGQDQEDPEINRLEAIAEDLKNLPGVDGVALTSVLPLTSARGNNTVYAEGYTGPEILAERRFVSANFFEVAGIPMVEGRAFQPQDDREDAAGTMIVSESLANRVWPGESAVGRTVSYWGDRVTTVVGVAADQRDENLREPTAQAFYVPRRQAQSRGGSFLVRTSDPEGMVGVIADRVRSLDASAAVIELQPVSRLLEAELAEERYRARLASILAVLAALFSIMGIYGVTARAVSARTREFGIRKVLGARDLEIMGHVFHQAARLGVVGGLIGLALAFPLTRLLESLLWGVSRSDPLTLVAVALAMAAGSVLAAAGSGWRAHQVEPAEALRAE